jgi:hypothetical protein
MIYGIALLLFILGLSTGIPSIPQLLRMREIKKNGSTTTGIVQLNTSAHPNTGTTTGMMSSILGKVNHPQFLYKTPDEKELTIEVIDSSTFQTYRYKSGETVEIVYDKNAPWLAYVQKEWDHAYRDLWLAGAEILTAAVLLSIGLAFKLPM